MIAATTERIRAADDRYTYLYTLAGLERFSWTRKSPLSEITFPDDKTVYLLTNFTNIPRFMNENQEKLKSRPNIIIDQWGKYHDTYNGRHLGHVPAAEIGRCRRPLRWYEHVYRSNKDQPLKYEYPDENTASASENDRRPEREPDNVELIGTKTFGKGTVHAATARICESQIFSPQAGISSGVRRSPT